VIGVGTFVAADLGERGNGEVEVVASLAGVRKRLV
jgi:hypothetical protein